jgi:hypothetical protein
MSPSRPFVVRLNTQCPVSVGSIRRCASVRTGGLCYFRPPWDTARRYRTNQVLDLNKLVEMISQHPDPAADVESISRALLPMPASMDIDIPAAYTIFGDASTAFRAAERQCRRCGKSTELSGVTPFSTPRNACSGHRSAADRVSSFCLRSTSRRRVAGGPHGRIFGTA